MMPEVKVEMQRGRKWKKPTGKLKVQHQLRVGSLIFDGWYPFSRMTCARKAVFCSKRSLTRSLEIIGSLRNICWLVLKSFVATSVVKKVP